MSADGHTRIGSVTNTSPEPAVLQLVDQDGIRWSDPISLLVDFSCRRRRVAWS